MKTLSRPAKHALEHREPGDLYWVATNIHRLRQGAGWTQTVLADKAGITSRALRGIENAETDANPTLKTLEAIAKALGVETGSLYKRRKGKGEVEV